MHLHANEKKKIENKIVEKAKPTHPQIRIFLFSFIFPLIFLTFCT